MSNKRTRMFFDADEDLKLAVQLEALGRGTSASELIGNILRDNLKTALAEARKKLQDRKKGNRAE
jgi:thioredoxin-like negative regulator of GroEL